MRDGIDEFGETAPDQADLIAIEEAREAWALTRSHGASDDPLSPPTPQNLGFQGVLRRAWDVAAGIWGSNPALICPYDDSGPSVRLVGCLNARVGCCYVSRNADFSRLSQNGHPRSGRQGRPCG